MKKIFFPILILAFLASCSADGRTSADGTSGTVVAQANTVKLADYGRGREKPVMTELSSFSTEYGSEKTARAKNIKLAAELINDTVVPPNETFSYNGTVGPTTKERGFARARVFSGGKDSYGYGGGVCQVSSTLFNAVTEAGLEVTERHPHSKKVYYVDEGKDAATSHGSIDFKFRNGLDAPVLIRARTEDGKVTVGISKIS